MKWLLEPPFDLEQDQREHLGGRYRPSIPEYLHLRGSECVMI